MIVQLPPRFYYDHVARDLPAGRVVRATRRHVFVEVGEDERAELLSDARHYASAGNGLDVRDYAGLIASARATVRALEKTTSALDGGEA